MSSGSIDTSIFGTYHTEASDETGEVELHVEDFLNGIVNFFESCDTSVVDIAMVGKDVQSWAGSTLISGTGRDVRVSLI